MQVISHIVEGTVLWLATIAVWTFIAILALLALLFIAYVVLEGCRVIWMAVAFPFRLTTDAIRIRRPRHFPFPE